MTWDRVDWDARELRIKRSKTGADQIVPIDDTLAKIMQLWRGRDAYKIRRDLIVPTDAVSLANPGRTFARLCTAARIEPYGKPLHTLRKSCISDWARRHPPHVVQVWAGHRSLQTTLNYYTRISPADMDAGKGPAPHRRAQSSPKKTPKPLRLSS